MSKDTLEDSVKEDEDLVYAVEHYKGVGEHQLSFSKGDEVKVKEKINDQWWWAEVNGSHGYVPASYLVQDSTFQMYYWEDEEYFGQYGGLKIHHEMLSDKPRNKAYQTAIKNNADYLKDKVILDVGCGTGILSMMCAHHAQPAKVYAVDASNITEETRKVVAINGFSDIITVLYSYVEDLSLEQEVDLLISEWMGTALFFEMMIESVIIARDKLLKTDGILWPSKACLYLVPCSAHSYYKNKIGFWKNQYGFNFSSLIPEALSEFTQRPAHNYELNPSDCLSEESSVLTIEMKTVTVDMLEDNSSSFEFVVTKTETCHGFCTWFQADFCGLDTLVKEVSLNTGPQFDLTHWKQNLFVLDNPLHVMKDDVIRGTFRIFRNPKWRRHLRVHLTFQLIRDHQVQERVEKEFMVWK